MERELLVEVKPYLLGVKNHRNCPKDVLLKTKSWAVNTSRGAT